MFTQIAMKSDGQGLIAVSKLPLTEQSPCMHTSPGLWETCLLRAGRKARSFVKIKHLFTGNEIFQDN